MGGVGSLCGVHILLNGAATGHHQFVCRLLLKVSSSPPATSSPFLKFFLFHLSDHLCHPLFRPPPDPQCIGHITALLLQSQPSLQQPALKLMAESGDERLLQLTLDQLKGMSAVSVAIPSPNTTKALS